MSLIMANNSDNCHNSSKWHDAEVDIARASLSLASTILCAAAVILLVYSKYYRSFNYRLILYLLIANIISSLVDALQMPFYWYFPETSLTLPQRYFCHALGFLEVYASWNLLLTVSFLIVEIFTMISCGYALAKLEIPCTVACFGLPCIVSVVPFITGSFALVDHYCGLRQYQDENCTYPDRIEEYIWFIPGCVVAGINVTIITVALLILAYKRHQLKSLSSPEREELIAKRFRETYSKALKETLPLVVYPTTVLVLLIIDSLNPINSDSRATFIFNCISDELSGCMGGISAATFFVHYFVKLQRPTKRAASKHSYGDHSQTINTTSTSTTVDSRTYYTADNFSEGSK